MKKISILMVLSLMVFGLSACDWFGAEEPAEVVEPVMDEVSVEEDAYAVPIAFTVGGDMDTEVSEASVSTRVDVMVP